MANDFLDEKGRKKIFKKMADIFNEALEDLTQEQQVQAIDHMFSPLFNGPNNHS